MPGRHYQGAGIPGQGWQCPICNSVVLPPGPCQVCFGDPDWLKKHRPPPAPQPTGAEKAQQQMEEYALRQPEPEAKPQQIELRLTLTLDSTDGLTEACLDGPQGARWTGSGVTVQEAVSMAVIDFEEDISAPRCPTCGQKLPQ